MKVTITYQLTDDDPAWERRLTEAYNTIKAFDCLAYPGAGDYVSLVPFPEIRAMNGLKHGGEFTAEGAAAIVAHLKAVAQLAYNGRQYSTSPASATLRQAAQHASEVAQDFAAFVRENLLTSQGIPA